MTVITTRATFRPVTLAGEAGRLFAVWYPPADKTTGPGWDLVCLPPFAEELNRSRRMMALQARAFAARGIGVLLFDLSGTGDSTGHFGDGRWPVWLADARTAADWLQRETGRPVGLWGLRFGGLMATALIGQEPGRFARLALWNPVTNGQSMVNQLLRIRIAAEMGRSEAVGVDTRRLRGWLADGDIVEVAGYALHPDLIATLDDLRLARVTPSQSLPVDWFELIAEAGRPLSPAARPVIEGWQQAGCRIAVHTPAGAPFWSLPDTTLCPALDLIRATTMALTA